MLLTEPFTQDERDEIEADLDNLHEEVMAAYGRVIDVSSVGVFTCEVLDDALFHALLASARDELEDALLMLEAAMKRNREEKTA